MKLDYISPEIFAKMVELAALALEPEESEYLRTELNHQLAAVKELSEIPLDDSVPANMHGIDCQAKPARLDDWGPFPDAAAILALAPEIQDGMIVVPDVARKAEEGK